MAEKQITKEQVESIAKLVKLKLSDEEISRLSTLLTDTLDYINVLDELDTSGVEETFSVTGLSNVYASDNNVTTLDWSEATSNAKEIIHEKFATEAIFDRD